MIASLIVMFIVMKCENLLEYTKEFFEKVVSHIPYVVCFILRFLAAIYFV
jgi:hypothetical protein